MRIEFCQGCGAPLESRWNKIVIVCRHCGSQNAPGTKGDPVPSSIPDDGRLRFAIDGRTYLVYGKLATGDSSEVYFGRWVRRLGELVVIKLLRNSQDRDLLANEHRMLLRLQNSTTRGTEHFANLIPEPIAAGLTHIKQQERYVSLFRWKSGFLHSLEEIQQVYPNGVDARVVVWVLKRVLELLHWSHESGIVHGAILPPHILVHPRDHGAMLIGWSSAAACDAGSTVQIPAVSKAWRNWYVTDNTASRSTDIAMAARCALGLAGASSFSTGGSLPMPLADLIIGAARQKHSDAWALRELVTARALDALGPPAYCPLTMPGWPSVTSN